MTRKYDRRYPTTGGSYNSPRRDESRYARVEDRLLPKEVWVRCCNKMHPIRITKSGKLSAPAHKNLKAERMMVKMGAKEPRCVTILRLWKGNPLTSDRDPDGESVPRYHSMHKQLAKHLPKELERAYAGGLKHRATRDNSYRFHFKTPLFKDDISWYPDDDEREAKPYWFREVLPQMAFERLLLKELKKTPNVVKYFKGRSPRAGHLEYEPRTWRDESDNYWNYMPYLTVENFSHWYGEEEKTTRVKVSAGLDRSFLKLTLSGKNRLKDGSLIVGMLRFGSHRHKIMARENPIVGENDIYVALTNDNTNVIDNTTRLTSEPGIIDEKGDWICLKQK